MRTLGAIHMWILWERRVERSSFETDGTGDEDLMTL